MNDCQVPNTEKLDSIKRTYGHEMLFGYGKVDTVKIPIILIPEYTDDIKYEQEPTYLDDKISNYLI